LRLANVISRQKLATPFKETTKDDQERQKSNMCSINDWLPPGMRLLLPRRGLLAFQATQSLLYSVLDAWTGLLENTRSSWKQRAHVCASVSVHPRDGVKNTAPFQLCTRSLGIPEACGAVECVAVELEEVAVLCLCQGGGKPGNLLVLPSNSLFKVLA
jgi:hypothetical protein